MNAHKRKKMARIEAFKTLKEIKVELPQQEKPVEQKKELLVEPVQETVIQSEESLENTQDVVDIEPAKIVKKKKSS